MPCFAGNKTIPLLLPPYARNRSVEKRATPLTRFLSRLHCEHPALRFAHCRTCPDALKCGRLSDCPGRFSRHFFHIMNPFQPHPRLRLFIHRRFARILFLLFSTLASSLLFAWSRALADEMSPRVSVDLNPGWRFFAGDETNASEPGFDDRAWQGISLPHTWNAFDGQDGGNNYRRGAGWYRRTFTLDPALAGKRLYLQFDGASLKADVYVNGRHLGTHLGGFARFRFDATEVLRPGENHLAVRVDNSAHLHIIPMEGDFTLFGGLYRSVSLLATDAVQVSTTDYASDGVYVSQHGVSAARADITLRALLENHGATARPVAVHFSITTPEGGIVSAQAAATLPPGGGKVPVEQSLALFAPRLWNGRADPALHTVRVEIRDAGGASGVLDAVTTRIGVRSIRVDPARGFFLNEKPCTLHGVNRHQDRPDKGWAISDDDEAEDLAMILEIGATAIRASHYQQSKSWYDRADRAGLLVWTEIPFVGKISPDPVFSENAREQLRELIRQNYNHPSIVCWGVGNETRGEALPVLAGLARLAREEDPARPATYASDHGPDDPRNFVAELVAFNRYFGWYRGELGDLGKELDAMHASYPETKYGISEYGAGASIRQHQEDPPKRPASGAFHPGEYQNKFHEAAWAQIQARPWLWCSFVWNMFDFASDKRAEGDARGINDKGLVTYDRRVRKDAFFLFKANWGNAPVLHITSRRYTPRADAVTEIKIYTNAPAVELFVNGEPQGAREPDATRVTRWPGITLRPGENKIEARAAFADGTTATDSCVWELAPEKAPPIPKK